MCEQAVQTLDAGVKAATPIVEEGIKVATPYVQEAGDALSKVASRCVDPPCHRPLSAQPSARPPANRAMKQHLAPAAPHTH